MSKKEKEKNIAEVVRLLSLPARSQTRIGIPYKNTVYFAGARRLDILVLSSMSCQPNDGFELVLFATRGSK
jgi:hypothetical protein